MAALKNMTAALRHFVHDERAQDAFEYLLVVGGISVAVVLAMVSPVGQALVGAVIDGTCGAIDTVVTQVNCA